MSQRAGQKAESRARIVRAASRLLRSRGLSGASVGRSMRGAGLTVGTFYAHFRDKTALLREAFEAASDEMEGVLREAAGGSTGPRALRAVVSKYLSEGHLEAAGRGCPLPAVAGEAASSRERSTHRLLADGVARLQRRLLAHGGGGIDAHTALALCALLVGGQILARATRGTPMSTAVLRASTAAAHTLIREACT